MSSSEQRAARLLPGGSPRYVRCYDYGDEMADRYTAVFTGNYVGRDGCDYLGMSVYPFHPQGVGQHGWSRHDIDRPRYSRLGKKISFLDLPPDCQRCVLQTYRNLWRLEQCSGDNEGFGRSGERE